MSLKFTSTMVNDKIRGNSGPATGQKSPSPKKAPKKGMSKSC